MPLIAPPTFRAVHRKHALLRVHRDNGFLTEITCPAIQAALVTPKEPTLLPTIRTERGRRDRVLLAVKYRRELIEEGEIVLCDLKNR